MVTDPTRSLRYYGGLAAIILGIAPPLLLSLLVSQGSAAKAVVALLAVGIPVNLVGIWFAVRGMAASDPDVSGRRIGIGFALVAAGAVIMLVGNALLSA
jgi:hypothetical protein